MHTKPIFQDRTDAGRKLAEQIRHLVHDSDVLVLALPRGGVPIGYEVAQALHAELDVFVVRKLGLPDRPELAVGAIASGGVRVLNEALVKDLGLSSALIERLTAREATELQRREDLYRQGRTALPISDRVVILVDDGLATGASMTAAMKALRLKKPKRVIVGVPVGAEKTCEDLRRDADVVVCVCTPEPFLAVSMWYEDFAQTTDEEVQQLLRKAAVS
ncbi:MAG TPA: phosphoribosyltransferase [Bryobacteraceae bacterium]